jgi:hypothetical protein
MLKVLLASLLALTLVASPAFAAKDAVKKEDCAKVTDAKKKDECVKAQKPKKEKDKSKKVEKK